MFEYCMPGKIFFGTDCIKQHGAQLKKLGKKACLVTGKNSAKQNGSLQDMQSALQENGVDYVVFDQVSSNPSVELVREAAGLVRAARADMVVGIGGGSPLDAAKAIAILAANEISDADLFSGVYQKPVLPVVAVPTTAGTGSEVTQYSILTNKSAESKTSIASEAIFPRLAFVDARYTAKLPLSVTIHTAIDALSHAVEGYLAVKASPVSSLFAARSIQILGECLPRLRQEINPALREKLLYASLLAGIVIAHTGTTAVHSLGYSLTYFKNIDHGRANGLLLYEFLRFIAGQQPAKVEEVVGLLGCKDLAEVGCLLDSLLGERDRLAAGEIECFAGKALTTKNIQNTLIQPTQRELENILRNSLPTI